MLILSDSTANNAGIPMKKLPLTDTRLLPPSFKYKGVDYSLECGVVFETLKKVNDIDDFEIPCVQCIPNKVLETPINGQFVGNYVCRDLNKETPDNYNPDDWDDLSKYTQSLDNNVTYYTWVMYLRVDDPSDIPFKPNIRYVYNLYKKNLETGEETFTYAYPTLNEVNINIIKAHNTSEYYTDPTIEFFYKKELKKK